MTLLQVVGACPNFPKLAPVHRGGHQAGVTQIVVHTGQHYDAPSGGFFRDLGIAPPVLDLVEHAFAVITDSGGLQEETTALGVPCLTVRPNTERPITISEGTNRLVPDLADIANELRQVRRPAVTPRLEGWDGRAGERVIAALVSRR